MAHLRDGTLLSHDDAPTLAAQITPLSRSPQVTLFVIGKQL